MTPLLLVRVRVRNRVRVRVRVMVRVRVRVRIRIRDSISQGLLRLGIVREKLANSAGTPSARVASKHTPKNYVSVYTVPSYG